MTSIEIRDKIQALLIESGSICLDLGNTVNGGDSYLELRLAMDHLRAARDYTSKIK